jgi:hypothetical protein
VEEELTEELEDPTEKLCVSEEELGASVELE